MVPALHAKTYSPEEHRCLPNCVSSLEELDVEGVAKVRWVHGAEASGEPPAATLKELGVRSVGQVSRVH